MTTNRGHVTLEFQDGSILSTFDSFELKDSFTDPLGDFSFTLKPSRSVLPHYNEVTRPGELVKLAINGHTQATMAITKRRRRTTSDGGIVMELGAKTPLVVPHRGAVDPTIATHFTSATPATEVILRALGPYSFDFVVGDDTSNVDVLTGKPIGKKSKKASIEVGEIKVKEAEAHEGETAYGFCARTVLRLGVALRCKHDGVLMLTAPNYDQPVSYRLVQDYDLSHAGDRMLTGYEVNEDNEDTYSEVIVRGDTPDGAGQKTTAKPLARVMYEDSFTPDDAFLKTTPTTVIPAHRGSYRSTSQRYKPLIVNDKLARDTAMAVNRGKRILGRTAERGWSFSCMVDGLVSQTGRIWTVDTVASVFCADYEIDEPLWIFEVVRRGARDGGQTTSMKLLPLNALQLGELPGAK